jgi:hypothetical protein
LQESYELVASVWELMKDYIPNKDKQAAAEHLMNSVSEFGLSDKEIIQLADHDNYLSDAWEAIKEETGEEDADEHDDYSDYGNGDWDE